MGPLRLFIFSGIEVLRQYWLSLVGKKKETNTYGKNALEEERVTLVNLEERDKRHVICEQC